MGKKSAPPRVLIVDDEMLIRWAIAETLTSLGYSVVEAGDGESALRALADTLNPVAVILLDFRLPDSNDLALLTAIRHVAPRSQVILMTAYGTPEVTQGALERGAFRVVTKPFELHQLTALVRQAEEVSPF